MLHSPLRLTFFVCEKTGNGRNGNEWSRFRFYFTYGTALDWCGILVVFNVRRGRHNMRTYSAEPDADYVRDLNYLWMGQCYYLCAYS